MKRGWAGYAFLAPATLHLVVFALAPILYALYLSFFDWNLLKDARPFVGLENYARALSDPAFGNAMWNSARYTLIGVPLGMATALAVALLTQRSTPLAPLFRTLYYIPAISSGVAISMLWIYMYLPESGLINAGLKGLGFSGTTDFLNDKAYAMPALIFMSIWVGLGPRMILFLAGLVGIDPSLYEAASLDGAGAWRSFWRVTLPSLAPTTLFVWVTSTIGAFQVFTPVYMMTKGGPMRETDVVGYHIYTEAWRRFEIGSASAQSFLLLAVVAAVSAIQYRLMRDRLRESAL